MKALLIMVVTSFFALIIHILNNYINLPIVFDLIYAFEYVFFIASSLLYFFLIFKYIKKNKKIKINTISVLLILFYTWMLISCLLSENYKNAFFGETYRIEGYKTYLIYLNYAIAGYLLYKNNKFNVALKFFVIISTLIGILVISKLPFIYELFNENQYYYQYSGPFYHFNHYGYYLIISFIFSVYLFFTEKEKNKIIYFLTTIIISAVLIINNTFGVYVAALFLILSVTIFLKKQTKEKIMLIGVFLILSLFINKNGDNVVLSNFVDLKKDVEIINNATTLKEVDSIGTYRGRIWRVGIEIALEKPIVGHGLDNSFMGFVRRGVGQDRAHNIIIDIAIALGIIGVTIYLLILFIPGVTILKRIKKIENKDKLIFIGVFTYFVNLMFGNSMYYTSIYYYFLLGAMVSIYVKIKHKEKKDEI